MTNKLEKQFFDTFGIEPKYVYLVTDMFYTSNSHNYEATKNDLIKYFGDKNCGRYKVTEVHKTYPQITDHILLELICLNNTYLWETHTSTVNELKNVLLNKYIEHVNLMADENEKQEYINQVRTLFEES